jgi:hypothetical protein
MMRAPGAMVSASGLRGSRHDGGGALEGYAIEDLRGGDHFMRARTLGSGHRAMYRREGGQRERERETRAINTFQRSRRATCATVVREFSGS